MKNLLKTCVIWACSGFFPDVVRLRCRCSVSLRGAARAEHFPIAAAGLRLLFSAYRRHTFRAKLWVEFRVVRACAPCNGFRVLHCVVCRACMCAMLSV